MPIKDKSLYPENWTEISLTVREEAGQRCEFCGAVNYQPHPITGSKVVLTVAHLDHNPGNNDRANLKALCQKCHLTYDAQHHAESSRQTRLEHERERIAQTGQLSFLE